MMIEDTGFKKDETPYYVFACSKCQQYSYVKTTKKTKKCLRCGRINCINIIASLSEVIKGITAAKDRVIALQDELARKELGFEPALRANNDFSLIRSKLKRLREPEEKQSYDDKSNEALFKAVLNSLQQQYSKYPRYLIELAAQDKSLSKRETEFLITEFINKGILKMTKDTFYYLAS